MDLTIKRFEEQPVTPNPDTSSPEELLELMTKRSPLVKPFHLVGIIKDLQSQIYELKREVEALKRAQS